MCLYQEWRRFAGEWIHWYADRGYAAPTSLAVPYRTSMALTEFLNAFSKTPFPIVPTTKPTSHPLRFLPSRTVTRSISVKPSGRRVKV